MTGKGLKENFPDIAMNRGGITEELKGMTDALRTSCGEAVDRINREREKKKRILVSVDGPCASGKTTLAGVLAGLFGAGVVHTDDFVLPHWRKTPERLRIPGGNLDDERLIGEVLEPWKKGEKIIYSRYDCHGGRFIPADPIFDAEVLFLEGSYALLPSVRRYTDVPLFVTAPWEVRRERLKKRESPESYKRFMDLWIPLENVYFEAYSLPDGTCTVICG